MTKNDIKRLKRVNVVPLDLFGFALRCGQCGEVWSPVLGRGGKMPKNGGACPNGCNADLMVQEREK